MSLMSPLGRTTEPAFIDRLTKIDKALTAGNLITTDLQVVEKNGVKWAWIKFYHTILTVFSYFTGQDPWQAYRINAIAKSLSTFTANNSVTPKAKKHIEDIMTKLEVKVRAHSSERQKAYLHALEMCKENIKVLPIIPSQIAPIENQKLVRRAINTFANELCAHISASLPPNKSYSISPISIMAALGMCLHIIKAEMKEQFISKMGLRGFSETEIHSAIAATLNAVALPEEFTQGTIDIANSLAVKDISDIAPSFINLLKGTYNAEIIVSNDLQGKVNEWVNAKTHGMLPEILGDNNADFVLVNAICLALGWENTFIKPAEGWDVGSFIFADGSRYPVSMMTQTGTFGVYRGSTFTMLKKDYLAPDGRQLTQLIFQPDNPKNLAALERILTAENIAKYQAEASDRKVDLSMPKTKGTSKFNLLYILKAMGFPLHAIDEKIIGSKHITDIIHETFFTNDEKGTKAAAATAVLRERCMQLPPLDITIDSSYASLVLDGDMILFRGRATDPEVLVLDK